MDTYIQGKWRQQSIQQKVKLPDVEGSPSTEELYKTYCIQNIDDRLFYVNNKLHGVWSIVGDILIEVDYAGNCTKYKILELKDNVLKLSDFTTMAGMELVEGYERVGKKYNS